MADCGSNDFCISQMIQANVLAQYLGGIRHWFKRNDLPIRTYETRHENREVAKVGTNINTY